MKTMKTKNKHTKHKFAEDIVKDLKVLDTMDIDAVTKNKLKRQAKKWVKFIKLHSIDIKHPYYNMYHKGEMGFIEFFFLDSRKKTKRWK